MRLPAPPPWTPPRDRPARILIVRLSALGDVLHALPALVALRRLLPDAAIDWAVEDRAADLLAGRTELRRVIVLPRRALRSHGRPRTLLRATRAFVGTLREGRYDVALDLQGNLKSGLVARASRARVRFGLDRPCAREGNHLFTTHRARPPARAVHRVERGLALVAGLLHRPAAWADPGWPLAPDAARAAARCLAAAGLPPQGYAVLHPGTSRFGAFKRWPPDRHAWLARRLAAGGRAVAVTAAPEERALAEAVVREADGGAAVLEPPDLATLAEVIRRAAVFVGADTGPLQIAGLVGTPLVGLFGPKDPAVYAPYGRRADGTVGPRGFVVREDVACRPCRLRDCAAPVCMTGLAPERVWRAVEETLGDGVPFVP